MTDTLWIEKRADGSSTGAVTVIGRPDWVKLPPELGGGQVRVRSQEALRPCPKCPVPDNLVETLALDNNMFVGQCPTHGFVWYSYAS